MIHPHVKFLRKCLYASDLLLASILFPLAANLQNRIGEMLNMGVLPFLESEVDWNVFHYATHLIWLLPLWYFSLALFKAYDPFSNEFTSDTIFSIIHASVLVSVCFAGIFLAFGLYTPQMGYSIVLIYPAVSAVGLVASRIVLMAIFHYFRTLGYNQRNLLIVGTGPRAVSTLERLVNHREWGFHFLGFIALEHDAEIEPPPKEYKVLGTIGEIRRILDENPVDEVLFIVPRKWLDRIDDAVLACDLVGVNVHVAVDLFDIKVSRPAASEFYDLPVLSLHATSTSYAERVLKRVIDLVGAIVGIVILSPFALLIAALIRFESRGPVLFVQKRCSMNGRIFPMLKFRTMVENAEDLKHELLPKNEQDGPVFKMKTDPRVTRFGRFLRKSSLDELPQLVNVLLGHMSLVGPRPPIPSEVEKYEPWQRRRLSMRPGLTCIWQISGRNEVGFEKWMAMDLEYIDNWSLWLDFKILLKTIPVVLSGRGSH
jgi:exopolysaccharide biosynthesis polyprenyl glycosylphosphotransferase